MPLGHQSAAKPATGSCISGVNQRGSENRWRMSLRMACGLYAERPFDRLSNCKCSRKLVVGLKTLHRKSGEL